MGFSIPPAPQPPEGKPPIPPPPPTPADAKTNPSLLHEHGAGESARLETDKKEEADGMEIDNSQGITPLFRFIITHSARC